MSLSWQHVFAFLDITIDEEPVGQLLFEVRDQQLASDNSWSNLQVGRAALKEAFPQCESEGQTPPLRGCWLHTCISSLIRVLYFRIIFFYL